MCVINNLMQYFIYIDKFCIIRSKRGSVGVLNYQPIR